MNWMTRCVTIIVSLVGCIGLIFLSAENNRIGAEVGRLEAELGRMPIDDVGRVHFVEIEVPDVPPEVATHVERVWQFRCYLPPGYDFILLSGSGRVTKEGVYLSGGYSSRSGSPSPVAIHQLLTVSFQDNGDHLEAFYSFGGGSGTTTWSAIRSDRFNEFVAPKLVDSDQGARSFDQNTIIPLLRIYDPNTAEDTEVAGKRLTTYAGGLILLCPKSREADLELLRRGEIPKNFDPSWIATEVRDE